MKKEIRIVDQIKKILQVTTVDERWYIRDMTDPTTGLPKYEYVPSVTWICEHYPKGTQFYKWLASKGWDEAEAIKSAAGDKGSKVHYAVADLISGKEVSIDSKYKNNSNDKDEELTLEEYSCIMSFAQWCADTKPIFLKHEFNVFGDGYAGTVDLLCEIDKQKYLIDFKTSQSIWPSHELQVSAYKKAGRFDDVKLAILQLGYKLNKKKYKFTEVDDQFSLFLAAMEIWKKEQSGVNPKQRDYPLKIKLEQNKEKTNETTKK